MNISLIQMSNKTLIGGEMKSFCVTIIILITCLVFVPCGHAKWWIFGASEDEVELQYIYLNKVSFSELGQKIQLFRDTLPNGMVVIQGKATAGKNKIGSARVSIDGKQTWVEMKLSENGIFEYAFRPDINRTYQIYVEITDTRGKTNDVNKTYKEVIVTSQNIYQIVKDSMDKLISAYQSEQPAKFMDLVADDFTGDRTLLDRAIRKDFSAFDNIILRFILTNVTSDSTGKIFVTFNYNRQLTSVKTGKTLQDNGATQMTFKSGDKGLRIYSMKWPLIFGVSDPTNIAQGSVQQSARTEVIIVDNKGEASKVPAKEAEKYAETGESSVITAKSITLRVTPQVHEGFIFATETITQNPNDNPDIILSCYGLMLKPNTFVQDLGVKSIDTIKEVPTTGYQGQPDVIIQTMHSYAFKLSNNKYAVIEIVSDTGGGQACFLQHIRTVRIKYKYQPDGTNKF